MFTSFPPHFFSIAESMGLAIKAGFCSRFHPVQGQIFFATSLWVPFIYVCIGGGAVIGWMGTVLAGGDQPCVLLCVCFLIPGSVADGTVSEHWTRREHLHKQLAARAW